MFDKKLLLDKKLSRYQQAFNLAQEIHDFPRQVIALDKIGHVYRAKGNFQEANAMFSVALEMTREQHLRYHQGNIWLSMGWNYLSAGLISPAIYYNRAALQLGCEMESLLLQEEAWGNLGIAYRILGALDIAGDCHQRSIRACEELLRTGRDKRYEIDRAKEMANLAQIYLLQDRLEEVALALERALHIFELFSVSEMVIEASISLGRVLIGQGKYVKAESKLNQGMVLAKRGGNLLAQVRILCLLAELSFRQGDAEEAQNLWLDAKELQYDRWITNERQSLLTAESQRNLSEPKSVALTVAAAIMESKLLQVQEDFVRARKVLKERIRVAEQYRLVSFESLHQIATFRSQIDVYDELIKLLIRDKELIEAFNYVEKVKSRALLDELRFTAPLLPKGMPETQQSRVRALVDTITRSIRLSYTENVAEAKDLLAPIPVALTTENDNLHYQAFLARRELNKLVRPYLKLDEGYAALYGDILPYEKVRSVVVL